MKFMKYHHIENLTNQMLDKFKSSQLYDPSEIWIILEKIHGSNLSIIGNGKDPIIVAKRTGILNLDEKFYNFQKILEKYDFNMLISKVLDLHISNYDMVAIHGELCGGIYPGMPTISDVKMVQKEVKYSNDTEFIVFDIKLYNDTEDYIYLNYDMVISLCNECNIPVVPILFRGTFDECIEWSSEHNADASEIWKIFGMPFEIPNNIREGHVIKPLIDKHTKIFIDKNLNISNHNCSRIIFKDKNNKFKENINKKESKEKISYSNIVNRLFDKISSMICISRFNNIVSKYGEYTIKDFSNLMNLMVDDIFEELENDIDMTLITNDEKNILRKYTTKKVSSFMGTNKKELF
jgi:Rnl2 family RNA ligase